MYSTYIFMQNTFHTNLIVPICSLIFNTYKFKLVDLEFHRTTSFLQFPSLYGLQSVGKFHSLNTIPSSFVIFVSRISKLQ